jgi:ribonuclease G
LLPWFRRRRKTAEQAPAEAAAPEQPETPEPPAEGGDDTTKSTRPKRRRGTRGGRGRKKATTPAGAEAADEKKEAPGPARKPSERERRSGSRQRATSSRRTPARRPALPPAKRELLVSVDVSEQRVAVVEDGRVAEAYLERPERRSIAGNIYLGVVDNVLPGMEAAFVEIGLEKNGFLYVDEIVVPELEGKRHGKKIQDLIGRGEKILVQAVKDPMKTKGARLTTEISLPGRFVVFVPQGEGLGVSRRLPDEERTRLKEIIKGLDVDKGGVIVRTAAEGASAEDVERDLVFLQRLWKSIQTAAKEAEAPALVYQEAELPLRVVRDLFAGDFERALVDHERTFRRIVGYLKKTSPHMVERVERYKEREPLLEAHGVDAEIRSTLNRRVDLPSGGYLIFDYAEAFTVIDVNTGRFVGSRSKTSTARLEDTITKNNLEAVKEVVRQLRLRDIGGIIVIDFIDMANPKNRAAVEEALRTELERDRTKTYVVEISPLGLVEMTRQNVTDGPREILTKKCPTCLGDGIVVSEASAAVEVERRLRSLVTAGSRTQAYKVELHPRVASILIGPGASRLVEIEELTRRRFFIQPAPNGHGLDHFEVLGQGKLDDLKPEAPVEEGAEVELKLVQVGLHDPSSAIGKVDGFEVCVGDAAGLVGKKVKVRVERVLDGAAYAARLDGVVPDGPITAEGEAEKPTRKPPTRKGKEEAEPKAEAKAKPGPKRKATAAGTAPAAAKPEAEAGAAEVESDAPEEEKPAAEKPKKRTRRGSRGGRGRKRKTAAETAAATADQPAADAEAGEPAEAPAAGDGKEAPAPRIHVPDDDLGRDGDGAGEREAQPAVETAGEPEADGVQPPKKRARRGSRGGRGRRQKAPVAAGAGAENAADDAPEDAAGEGAPSEPRGPGEPSGNGDWEYTPMSEWEREVDR